MFQRTHNLFFYLAAVFLCIVIIPTQSHALDYRSKVRKHTEGFFIGRDKIFKWNEPIRYTLEGVKGDIISEFDEKMALVAEEFNIDCAKYGSDDLPYNVIFIITDDILRMKDIPVIKEIFASNIHGPDMDGDEYNSMMSDLASSYAFGHHNILASEKSLTFYGFIGNPFKLDLDLETYIWRMIFLMLTGGGPQVDSPQRGYYEESILHHESPPQKLQAYDIAFLSALYSEDIRHGQLVEACLPRIIKKIHAQID